MLLNYKTLHSSISKHETNAIYYLLRKYGELHEKITLQEEETIKGKYGDYTLYSSYLHVNNVESYIKYNVIFTIFDYNNVTNRTVNVETIVHSSDEFTVALPTLETGESLSNDIEIVMHYDNLFIQMFNLNVDLSCDKLYVGENETATITAVITDDTATPIEDYTVDVSINGEITSETTDSDGVLEIEYTGTGDTGKVTVTIENSSITFYDGGYITIGYRGSRAIFGNNPASWLKGQGNAIVDWGDGITETIALPTNEGLDHTYTDNQTNHTIKIVGNITSIGHEYFYNGTSIVSVVIPEGVTSLGENCFGYCDHMTSVTLPDTLKSLGNGCFKDCLLLTSIILPDSITSMGEQCFYESGLTSITIPNSIKNLKAYTFYWCNDLEEINIPSSVTSLGYGCFEGCESLTQLNIASSVTSIQSQCFKSCVNLTDLILNWRINGTIVRYNLQWFSDTYPTMFYVPLGSEAFYLAKNYPSNRIRSGDFVLDVSSTKSIIQSAESVVITAKLGDADGDAIPGKTLSYQIKHGSTVLDSGSDVTDSNGEIDISYTGTAVGQVDVIVSYGSLLQETFVLYDSLFVDDITKTYSQNGWSARNVSVNRGTNDTTLTTSLTSGYGGYYRDISSLNSFCIEFDLNTDKSYGSVIDVQSTSSEFLLGSVTSLLHIGEDVHYKLEFKNNNIVISNNKGDTPITVADTNYSYFRIRVRYDATITYKNFIIYPL